jgi:AcrR family transcriptional regulator
VRVIELNGYEKRTKAKKEAIIEAARELFAARGMQDVGISEIAKRAGVSQVSIYNYFGDKSALAKEAFVAYIAAAIGKYEEIMGREIPFAEKLALIVQDKSDMIGQAALSHFNERALSDAVLRQVFQEAIREKAAVLYRSFIERGKNEGAIDKAIPTEAAMAYFMMSMSLFQSAEFMAAPGDYKMGIMKLFLYGLVQK